MARKSQTVDEKIEKLQEESWRLSDEIDRSFMKLKDRVMDSGFVLTESELMEELYRSDNSNSVKSDYLDLLKEMKIFYTRIYKQQESVRV